MDPNDSGLSLRLESTSLSMLSASMNDNPITNNSQKTISDIQSNCYSDPLYDCANMNINQGVNDSIIVDKRDNGDLTAEEVELRAKRIEMSFNFLDALSLVFSMFSFLLDFVTDIAVAIFHYLNQDFWYSALTATFIIVPNSMISIISFRWYLSDSQQENANEVGRFQWALRILFHVFQVGPILRYYESLQFGLRFKESRNQEEKKKVYMRMIYEDADATMLRLFESFMESAPQLMLQMYIMTRNFPFEDHEYWTVKFQMMSICSSLISISWSLVSYSKSLRISLPNKIPMTYTSIAVMFSWELCSVTARMIALALYTSSFVRSVGFILLFHWICMTTWIISMKTQFCDTKVEELGFNAMLGVIFIFCYFNPIDSDTRYRYLGFYSFMFCENSILMFIWFNYAPQKFWFKEIVIYSHYATFFLGLILMLIYYRYFHPTGGIRPYRIKC